MQSLTEILTAAQSLDAAARDAALQQIEMAKSGSLEQFIGSLMQEFADDQKPQASRHMAGILLKNTMSARSSQVREAQAVRWLASSSDVRKQVKHMTLQTMGSPTRDVRITAALVAACIATVELPHNQWETFFTDVCGAAQQQENQNLREAALACVGYLCEETEHSPGMAAVLQPHIGAVLTVVVTAMRKEEPNPDIRHIATNALSNSLEFVAGAMDSDQERNAIMQMICEGTSRQLTQRADTRERAMECLAKVASLYYPKLTTYMQHIFALTLDAIQHDEQPVALQGIEFWTTLAEVEQELSDNVIDGQPDESKHYVRGAVKYLVDSLWECLLRQDEHADEGEWNVHAAACCCLQNVSICVGDEIVQHALPVVQRNIESASSWRHMDAATMLFGCIVEGTTTTGPLSTVWQTALPALLSHVHSAQTAILLDTTAWCIGRVAEHHSSVIVDHFLRETLDTMVKCLEHTEARIAAKACYCILNLASGIGDITMDTPPTNKMSPFFQDMVLRLLATVDRQDATQSSLRGSAWEALNALIACAARDTFPVIQSVMPNLIQRLETTIPWMAQSAGNSALQQHIAETQGLVCGLLHFIARKLDRQAIIPVADKVMQCFLTLFHTSQDLGAKQSKMQVQEEVLMAVGAIASLLGDGFNRYLVAFKPFLLECLKSVEMPQVCQVAVGCLGDLMGAVREAILPHCDEIVTALLEDLRNEALARSVKPLVVATFGDIALHIGSGFERYLEVVMGVIENASSTVDQEVRRQSAQGQLTQADDLIIFQNEMREAVCQAYTGILQGLKTHKAQAFKKHVPQVLTQIAAINNERLNMNDKVHKSALGVIGDLADVYHAEIQPYLQNPSVRGLVEAGLASQDEQLREAAEWAIKEMCRGV